MEPSNSIHRQTELVLIRHGETDWNRAHRIQGHRQIPLNALGLRQAQATAAGLAGESCTALYSSDLLRARQTADAVAAVTGLAVVEHAGLREWDLGLLAGETHESAARRVPEAYALFRDKVPDVVIPGGESIRQRYTRVVATVEAIAAAHGGGRVVVVTHGGPLDDCYRRATGMPLEAPRDFPLFNAAVSRVRVAPPPAGWSLQRWGDVGHLEGIELLDSMVRPGPGGVSG